ncbi:MAG: hypothetical protein GX985_07600 [Gallicola sp.]|nr:hypothetical protein [Gallicola sp.]
MNWKRMITKTLKVLLGLFIAGIGTAFLYELGWGSNPSATMIEGTSIFFNLSYGLAGIAINIVFLILLFILDRKLIGVGTVLTTFFFGYFIDIGAFIISPLSVPEMGIVLKAVVLVVGCLLTAIGLGYYVGQFFGAGAMDAMSVILHQRCHIKFSFCRWGLDILMMVLGVLMGASWGIGTIGTILVTAPIMEWIIDRIKKKEQTESLN